MILYDYQQLLNKVKKASDDYYYLLAAVKTLKNLVESDQHQDVESALTSNWQYGSKELSTRTIRVNAKNLLKYYESELVLQKQKYDILLNRINNTRLQ